MPFPQDPRSQGPVEDHFHKSDSDVECDERKPRTFTFISTQDKCGSRKVARSHVAREIWEQKRRNIDEARTHGVPGELVWRLKKKSAAKTVRKKVTGKELALRPTAVVPGTTLVNPFPNFELDYGPETQELLHHCKYLCCQVHTS